MIETEQVFTVVGVILVLFFATLLLSSKRYKNRANNYLAFSLITLSLILLQFDLLLEQTIFNNLFEYLRIEFMFSVFLYLYACETIQMHVKRLEYILLIAPFILFSAFHSFVSITDSVAELLEPFEVYAALFFNCIVILLVLVKVNKSKAPNSFKKWINIIANGLLIILLLFFILEITELLFDIQFWNYLAIGMSFFFIGITYIGVQQLQIEQERNTIKSLTKKVKSSAKKLNHEKDLTHFEKMKLLMEEETLFKDSDLDRNMFANKLGLSVSSISRILKDEGQTSLNDFIKSYRIAEAKKMLKDDRFNIFSLEAIGKEVGFKSRSNFYELFKKEVGISPGVFKKREKNVLKSPE